MASKKSKLMASSEEGNDGDEDDGQCKKWWIFSLLDFSTDEEICDGVVWCAAEASSMVVSFLFSFPPGCSVVFRVQRYLSVVLVH